jgi:hypothetical protein
MNCYFHDSKTYIKTCINCKKNICEDCYHTDHSDYCWSCGLDYDNSLIENVKSFELPRILQCNIAQYILLKLAAAGGTWIVLTILGCFIFGLLGADEITPIALYFSIFTISITYTYGITCAIIIDLFNRFIRKTSRVITALIFLFFGIIFPWLMYLIDHYSNILNHPFNMLFGGIAAFLFFSIQQFIKRKEFIFILATLSSIIPLIYLTLMINGVIGNVFVS